MTESSKPLQLQVGKRYRRKNGTTTGVRINTLEGSRFPFMDDNGYGITDKGEWFGKGRPSVMDIISELSPSPAAPPSEHPLGAVESALDMIRSVLKGADGLSDDVRRQCGESIRLVKDAFRSRAAPVEDAAVRHSESFRSSAAASKDTSTGANIQDCGGAKATDENSLRCPPGFTPPARSSDSSAPFAVGQEVECVDATGWEYQLKAGARYKVDRLIRFGVAWKIGVDVGNEAMYGASRFRRVPAEQEKQ